MLACNPTSVKMALPTYLQTQALSHSQQVCRLYKAALRNLSARKIGNRIMYRYNAVVLRAEFDQNKDEVDVFKAKQLLAEGQKLLFLEQPPQPVTFHESPGGNAYGREPSVPDWLLDTWHPLEKAQYPEYFARRDIRKREAIERWEKKYGKPATS